MKSRAANGPPVQNQFQRLGVAGQRFKIEARRHVERTGGIKRVMIVAGLKDADAPLVEIPLPMPGTGGDLQSQAESYAVPGQRTGQRDLAPHQSAGKGNTSKFRESQAAAERSFGQLDGIKARADNRILQGLDVPGRQDAPSGSML